MIKYTFDIEKSIDWQRSNANKFISLIQKKQYWYDNTVNNFVSDWYRDVFNLETANDFGLELWAIILNVPLYGVQKSDPKGFQVFGFDGNSGKSNTFERGGFSVKDDSSYGLTTEQKRVALKLKAYAISMDGSCFEINKHLANIFGHGKIWYIDHFDMTITYKTTDAVIYTLSSTLLNNDLLPRPSGVQIREVIYITKNNFGFGYEKEKGGQHNFDHGVFK